MQRQANCALDDMEEGAERHRMSDRLTVKVIESSTLRFAQEAIPRIAPMDSVSHPCPHCGVPVRYPLHVYSGDMEALQTLLQAANRWLAKSGATADLLSEILAIATIAKAKK